MQSLSERKNLKLAAVATLLTAGACYPRLAIWDTIPNALWIMWLTLAGVMFVMWLTVFAWSAPHGKLVIFPPKGDSKSWVVTAGIGTIGMLFLFFVLDPQLREINPMDYPKDIREWFAMCLFSVFFEALFLCFTPLAFASRLGANRQTAAVFIVVLGLGVMWLKLGTMDESPSISVMLGLLVTRVGGGAMSIWCYFRGGAPLVWFWLFLQQARHLIFFMM